MSGDPSTSLRSQELGRELRRLRDDCGLKLQAAAKVLARSASSISRIENGKVRLPVRDVHPILDGYGVTDPVQRQAIITLAEVANEKGWWDDYDVDESVDLLSFEAAASWIGAFEVTVIPGLLQTPDYTTALCQGATPHRSEHEIRRHVRVRAQRRCVLDSPAPPQYHVIVSQAVLLQQVGGLGIMRRQLHRLLHTTNAAHIKLQVLPFSAGAHVGINGAFTIIHAPKITPRKFVFTDRLNGSASISLQADVQRYSVAFERLKDSALSEQDSTALLNELIHGH